MAPPLLDSRCNWVCSQECWRLAEKLGGGLQKTEWTSLLSSPDPLYWTVQDEAAPLQAEAKALSKRAGLARSDHRQFGSETVIDAATVTLSHSYSQVRHASGGLETRHGLP